MIKSTLLIVTLIILTHTVGIAQNETILIDSFEILKKTLEKNNDIDREAFDSLLHKLADYGDIHELVLSKIGESRRTPVLHDYYPAFLSYICNNMDSIYQKRIIEKIESDSIGSFLAYPFVKSCLFETDEQTCQFLNTLNLEVKSNQTRSKFFESLMDFRNEMKCGM